MTKIIATIRPATGREARLERIQNIVWADWTLTDHVKPDHVRMSPEK